MNENEPYKRINFLILCHKSPEQVKFLIKELQSPISRFYIHVDKKTDITEFQNILIDVKNIVFINDRIDGIWGDFSLVQATLNLIHTIKDLQLLGHTILLSGQDLPLHPIQDIFNFLKKNPNTNYIDIYKIPYKHWHLSGKDRLTFYNLHSRSLGKQHCSLPPLQNRFFYRKSTIKHIYLLLRYFPLRNIPNLLKKREQPNFITQWYGGAQWWIFNNTTLSQVIEKLAKETKYINFHKLTHIPDEIFFHTLITNLDQKTSIKPSLTYINWSRKNCELPVTFTTSETDVKELKNAKKTYMFARKVDRYQELQNLVEKIKK